MVTAYALQICFFLFLQGEPGLSGDDCVSNCTYQDSGRNRKTCREPTPIHLQEP